MFENCFLCKTFLRFVGSPNGLQETKRKENYGQIAVPLHNPVVHVGMPASLIARLSRHCLALFQEFSLQPAYLAMHRVGMLHVVKPWGLYGLARGMWHALSSYGFGKSPAANARVHH